MNLVQIDEYLYDEETGECAGLANPGYLPAVLSTEDDLQHYLRQLLEAETRLQAEERRYESVLANIRKMVQRRRSQVQWLRRTYESQSGKIAETLLPRKADGTLRTKTYRCPWGSVSLRETKPSLKIQEKDVALAFAKLECPGAVKTEESVLVSRIPEPVREMLMNDSTTAEAYGFHITDGGNSVTVQVLEKEKTDETEARTRTDD
jgi:hypothetical protein